MEKIESVVLGHAVGDALGVPVEFKIRSELDVSPVTDMTGFGTYPYPAGCWSDDTSMSLAALDSLANGRVDFDDILSKFRAWYLENAYTPTGETFDIGNTCRWAIERYAYYGVSATECGLADEYANGNGSLMRIHPFVLYAAQRGLSIEEREKLIDGASALTHAHERAKLGCGIYAFLLTRLLEEPSKQSVRVALRQAEEYYADRAEIGHYARLFRRDFDRLDRAEIKSSGYVVDTLEGAVWCLLTTDGYRECVLKAVNLGDDTDTVAAVAGGLAGALYGLSAIPQEWLATLKRREYIRSLCRKAFSAWK